MTFYLSLQPFWFTFSLFLTHRTGFWHQFAFGICTGSWQDKIVGCLAVQTLFVAPSGYCWHHMLMGQSEFRNSKSFRNSALLVKRCSRLEELRCPRWKSNKNKLNEQDVNILTPCQVAHTSGFFSACLTELEHSSGLLLLPLYSSRAMNSQSL